jgi:predicted RNA binding protein YcfA (HicA-like mRNA interferase family)
MKQGALKKKLHAQGCVFVKHGKKHDAYKNPRTGAVEWVPRHPDVPEHLAWAIIKRLS